MNESKVSCETTMKSLIAIPYLISTMAFAFGQDKPAKVTVEFRWLEHNYAKGVTEETGIKTSCGEELSYPHKTPILGNADIALVTAKNHGSVMGLPGDHFMITFTPTKAAREKLVEGLGDQSAKELAVFVDGKYWSTAYFRKSEAATFAPFAGFMKDAALVDRIVATFPVKLPAKAK
jgi:hypothetical protein